VTPAILAAQAAGIRFAVHEIDLAEDGSGVEAARALGVEAERVLKTLVAKLDGARLAVAILPVAAQLDLGRLAAAAGAKRASLASVREAERATGCGQGAISPLGQRRRLPAFLDASALAFETLFVGGGRRGLELELAPADLIRLCEARALPLCR
jgi:Cys-tRNA(Pro)/Cys-tRNA(Cys) deacylase